MVKLNFFGHNWLVHKINNDIVSNNLNMFKGVLYDLGCGKKPYFDDLNPLVDTYIGVDWTSSFHNPEMDIVADLNSKLPINSGVADCVVSFQVMEHLHSPKVFLAECQRILKSKGHILLTVPFQWHVHESPHDYYRYTEYGLKHLFKTAGFKDVIVEANSGVWVTLALKINYQLKRLQRGPKITKLIAQVFLAPIWFLLQIAAILLDKVSKNTNETVSYTVRAKKNRYDSSN